MYLLTYWFKNLEDIDTDFGTALSLVDSIEIKNSELENESNSPDQNFNNVDDEIDENDSSVLGQNMFLSGNEEVPIGDDIFEEESRTKSLDEDDESILERAKYKAHIVKKHSIIYNYLKDVHERGKNQNPENHEDSILLF